MSEICSSTLAKDGFSPSRRLFLRSASATTLLLILPPELLHAQGLDNTTPDIPETSVESFQERQRLEREYGILFGRLSEYVDTNGPDCLMDNSFETEPTNMCKNIPEFLDEERALTLERALKVVPAKWVNGAIVIPSIYSSIKSIVSFDQPKVVQLDFGNRINQNPATASLDAHELAHSFTFRQGLWVECNEELAPDGRVVKKATNVESDQFDAIYSILGGSFDKAPDDLLAFAQRIEEMQNADPSLRVENGFRSFYSGVRYLAGRKYPVEVGPVLVEWALRSSFDPKAPKDYFERSAVELFGKQKTAQLLRHTLDYFFDGNSPS